jgi:alkanesulfonate monooxygenase SsuD/methylene tetrahydromethanopterin reductase-like flavin-dependent oxidoreductase (luciferase family)
MPQRHAATGHHISSTLKIALRGAVYVALQAAGVAAIARGRIGLAVVIGWWLSYMWSKNVAKLAMDREWDRLAYATGAAIGTGLGLWLGHWF